MLSVFLDAPLLYPFGVFEDKNLKTAYHCSTIYLFVLASYTIIKMSKS